MVTCRNTCLPVYYKNEYVSAHAEYEPDLSVQRAQVRWSVYQCDTSIH